MSTRLAITVSGAVSLGSYEAGVLYEVLYALKQHNQQPGISEDQKIYIDVLTGASAGGLSVALAAQKLLYEAASLNDPYDNPLYNAWVSEVDIASLLNLAPDEQPSCSIFSSDLIDTLAQEYLLSRYNATPVEPVEPHPALAPDQTIRLGLALSNLCGVDYTRPTLSSGSFTYTRFQDEFAATLGGAQDSPAYWTPVQQAAVSCGAFPFAFRVQDLARGIDCYNSSPFFDSGCFGGQTIRSFTYTDGGLFQNQPLGLAKRLVNSIDQHLGSDQRAYLFVAPHPLTSTADDSFCARAGTFSKVAERLLLSIFDQARFQDWIEAEKINGQIASFNSRARALQQQVQNGTLSSEAIHPVINPLLAQFFGPGGDDTLTPARARLQQQFAHEYAQLYQSRGPDIAKTWLDAVLFLEMAANLPQKDEMYIYGITASAQELAGSPLMWFLGFFDRQYRDHDYDVGRIKARAFLQNPGTSAQGPLSAIAYNAPPIRPLQPGLTGISIKQVAVEKRQQLRDRIQNRIGIMLKEAGLSFIVRHSIQLLFLNGKINELLGL
jgi:predicted acylesterase/phospholipase RssA